MELCLVEHAGSPAAPPARKAKRRSLGGKGAAAEEKAEVAVSGPLECDRTYGLVLKCGVLADDGALLVQHALHVDEMEVADDDADDKRAKVMEKKTPRGGKKGRANKAKKPEGDDEEEEEEELRVIEDDEEDEGEGEGSERWKVKKNGNSGHIYFVWQLWTSPEEGSEEGRKDEGQQRKRRKSEARAKRGKSASEDDSQQWESDTSADPHPAAVPLKLLPAEAAALKLVAHDRAKGEARFDLTLSSAYFDSLSSSPFTRLIFAASARTGHPPTVPSPSTAVPTIGDIRQFYAFLPLIVKSNASPFSRPGPEEAGMESSGSSALSLPLLLPPLPPPPSSALALPPTLLPPIRLPAPPTVANDSAGTGGGDAWADFASKVKAATLQRVQKGKEQPEPKLTAVTADPATPPDVATTGEPAPQPRRGKRKSRHEEEIQVIGRTKAEQLGRDHTKTPPTQQREGASLKELTREQQLEKTPSQEGLRKWYDEQNVRTKSSEILQFLSLAAKRVDPKFLERFVLLHNKLGPVFEQFAHPETQHTLILILLHALTLTGYCVELIRFCYWVKDNAALSVDKIVDQATELSSQLVQLQFQKDVEEKLHGCLSTLLATLTALVEVISGPVYETYQPEKEVVTPEKSGKGKKFISLAKGNAVPWIKEWLKSSYAEVQGQSVAKKMVYKDYLAYCNRVGIEPTTSSVLGKIFREVFPFVSTRRLGSRNNNITYYSNIGPTSSLLAYSSASVQTAATSSASSSSTSSSSPPVHEGVMSPPSPPQVAISPAPKSRSRSTSLNSRNPSPPTSASSGGGSLGSPPSANGASFSSAPGERATYHMGSFRSSTPGNAFSYYPSPSYYSSSSSSSSPSGPRSSSSSSSGSSSLKRSAAGLPVPSSSFSSPPGRSNSPTPTSAFLAQSTASADLGAYSLQEGSGQFPLSGSSVGSGQASHYFTIPPISAPSSSASSSAPQSSAAAASAQGAPYPNVFLPAALSLLASFPHLAYASGLYPPPAGGGSGVPSGYPSYHYPAYPFPYPYPTDQQPTTADAAAAAAAIAQMQMQLPADPATAAALLSQYPGLAFPVKREQRDEAEQQMKEAEVQQHALDLDSARGGRRREERDEMSSAPTSGGRNSSPRTGRRHQQDGDSDSNESTDDLARNKRHRRNTKPRN